MGNILHKCTLRVYAWQCEGEIAEIVAVYPLEVCSKSKDPGAPPRLGFGGPLRFNFQL